MSAVDELSDAVVVAVGRGRLAADRAEQLLGQMLLGAVGVTVGGAVLRCRRELISAGLDADLIERARVELRGLATPIDAAEAGAGELVGVTATARVERLLKHMQVLGNAEEWATATTYDSLALAIIDCIWSIGVRYAGVRNVLARYRAFRVGEGAEPDRDGAQDLVAAIDRVGGPESFAELVQNRQRTSSRGGILKAEAVRLAARVLMDAEVQIVDELKAAPPTSLADLRARWTAIPGQGSGLSWDYLQMLSGRQGVKADRMVRRFVADALDSDEQSISQQHALDLVTEAAARLGVGVSQVDYAIWLHQSGNPPT